MMKNTISFSPPNSPQFLSNEYDNDDGMMDDETVGDKNGRQRSTSSKRESSSKPTTQKKLTLLLNQIMSLLKISSNLVSPTIAKMIVYTLQNIQSFLDKATPRRIKDWFYIPYTFASNSYRVIIQTPQGKNVIAQAQHLSAQNMRLTTSANSRQLLIEGMGTLIKAIDALNTPESKILIKSIPVLMIRFLDVVSSGEAKNLYHSMHQFICSIIELLGQQETTLAIAEITAHLVHVMEMERDYHGPMHRMKRRHGKRKTRVKLSAWDAKKRYERNRYIAQTYTNRIILSDNTDAHMNDDLEGVEIEDAILSSLGDTTDLSQDWLHRLGRDPNDASQNLEKNENSIPSLPPTVVVSKSNLDMQDKNESYDLDEVISIDNHSDTDSNLDDVRSDTVDITYLRSKIEKRESVRNSLLLNSQKGKEVFKAQPSLNELKPTTQEEQNDIEDLIMDLNSDDNSTSLNNINVFTPNIFDSSKKHEQNTQPKNRKESLTIEDYDQDENISPSDSGKENKPENRANQDSLLLKGGYSSVSHFYRTLDDIQSKMKNESITELLNQNDCDTANHTKHESYLKPKGKVNSKKKIRAFYGKAAVAAGVGNEHGQQTLKGMVSSASKVQKNKNVGVGTVDDSYDGNMSFTSIFDIWTNFIPRRFKIIIVLVILISSLFSIAGVGIGCHFMYKSLYLPKSRNASRYSPSYSKDEIIIRVVHEGIGSSSVEGQLKESISEIIGKMIREGNVNTDDRVVNTIL